MGESLKDRQDAANAVIERVCSAVKVLCEEPGDARQRVGLAVEILRPLRPEEFPSITRNDFRWVLRTSTKFKADPASERGNIQETMRRIRNSTASKVAKRIFAIYSQIQDIREHPLS